MDISSQNFDFSGLKYVEFNFMDINNLHPSIQSLLKTHSSLSISLAACHNFKKLSEQTKEQHLQLNTDKTTVEAEEKEEAGKVSELVSMFLGPYYIFNNLRRFSYCHTDEAKLALLLLK